jgi:hypothetical protein
MQFYPVHTLFRRYAKEYGYNFREVKRFYKDVLDNHSSGRFKFTQWYSAYNIIIEQGWYEARQPYYNIWPGVIDEFIKTRIDIDCELLKPPHECFVVRLPKLEEPIFTFNFKGKEAHIEHIMVVNSIIDSQKSGLAWKVLYNIHEPDMEPGNFTKMSHLLYGHNIEDCIRRDTFTDAGYDGKEYTIDKELMDALLRLVVAVHFLATGAHKILEFDVLSRHLAAYRQAEKNSSERKEYEKKAREKGKFGWNIGRGKDDRALKLRKGISYSQACKEAGGRELLYQHIRGGHWHTVKYGPKYSQEKVVWFDDTTVRPDLPPKPIRDKRIEK